MATSQGGSAPSSQQPAALQANALTSLLKSIFTADEYQQIKECIFDLSKIRTKVRDQQQQLQEATHIIERVQPLFNTAVRWRAADQLKASLPAHFAQLCHTIWKLNGESLTAQAEHTLTTTQPRQAAAAAVTRSNPKVKQVIEIDGADDVEVTVVGQSTRAKSEVAVDSKKTSQSRVTPKSAIEREQAMQQKKTEFIVEIKNSFTKTDYSKFKSLIVAIEAISPAMEEKDLRIVLKPLFAQLLDLFNSTSFGWQFAARYRELCYDVHRKFYVEILNEYEEKRKSRNQNRMTNGTATHIDLVTGMQTATKRFKT